MNRRDKHLVAVALLLQLTISVARGQRDVNVSESPARATRVISGQVFIVTKGREGVRLPLVDVLAIAESVALEYLVRRRSSVDSIRARTMDELTRLRSDIATKRDSLGRWDGLTPEWQRKYEDDEITFDAYTAGDPVVRRTKAQLASLTRHAENLARPIREGDKVALRTG